MLLRRTRRFVVLTVATATLGSVVITSAPGGAAHATPGASGTTPSSIDWGDCPEDGSDQASADDPTSGRLECGTLRVPLDYERPDGRTIEIAVSRLRSTDPSARRGVLLLNPGGPGQARLTMPRDMVDRGLPSSVRQSYDLIGFDPRGVGKSSPVSGRTPGQVRRTYQDIAERLDAEPVAEMDGTGFRQATRAMLYSDAAFGQLAQIWQGLSRREPTRRGRRRASGCPRLPRTSTPPPWRSSAVTSPGRARSRPTNETSPSTACVIRWWAP